MESVHNLKWHTKFGDIIRILVMKIGLTLLNCARFCLAWSGGRCSWCGKDSGFDSSVSSKGLRCHSCDGL